MKRGRTLRRMYRGERADLPAEKDDDIPYPGALENWEEAEGNMVVMTYDGSTSAVTLARVAVESKAAALMLVNMDRDSPDYIFSLRAETEAEQRYADAKIDIPVIMVSLSSGNLLTTATVEEGMDEEDIVNHGMPDRVRLYAAGDRPFFEDVIPRKRPVLYLIHNLLSHLECDSLVKAAAPAFHPIQPSQTSLLEHTFQNQNQNLQKAVLWKGQINSHAGKQIDERIEQVTGYPRDQYSDWHITKFVKGSNQHLHSDTHPLYPPLATFTVFLNDIPEGFGGEIVYPNPEEPPAVKIVPQKGMAIVHHNIHTHENRHGDQISSQTNQFSVHGDLQLDWDGIKYIAKKYVYQHPLPPSHTIALPIFAMMCGGTLPRWVLRAHDALLTKFGLEQGSLYFSKLCILLPLLILLLIAAAISKVVGDQVSTRTGTAAGSSSSTPASTSNAKRKTKAKAKKNA